MMAWSSPLFRNISSFAGFPSTTRFSRQVKSYKSGRTRGKIFRFFRSQGGCTRIAAVTRAKPSSLAANFSTMGPSTDKPASISWRWSGFSTGPRVKMSFFASYAFIKVFMIILVSSVVKNMWSVRECCNHFWCSLTMAWKLDTVKSNLWLQLSVELSFVGTHRFYEQMQSFLSCKNYFS